MTVRYDSHGKRLVPVYTCQRRSVEYGEKICQSIRGEAIDKQIGELLLQMVNPLTMEAALSVQEELNNRKREIDKYYMQMVERSRYEMELARRRYMNVDPDNRLVACQLESEWNTKLKGYEEAQESYEKQCQSQIQAIDEKIKSDIHEISSKFSQLWNDQSVPDREKKRLARCLIEDVTLKLEDEITLSIRFKGGTNRVISIPKPIPICQIWATRPEIIAEIDHLTDYYTPGMIACIFNERGLRSGQGKEFNKRIIERIIRDYNIRDRYTRLRELGYLSLSEVMLKKKVSQKEVQILRENGEIKYHKYCDGDRYLYEIDSLIN